VSTFGSEVERGRLFAVVPAYAAVYFTFCFSLLVLFFLSISSTTFITTTAYRGYRHNHPHHPVRPYHPHRDADEIAVVDGTQLRISQIKIQERQRRLNEN
jgi:hypothetical protein